MKKDPKDLVREGYDKIASQYDEYRDPFNNETELNELMSLVESGGHILDAGCGSGVVARALVDNGFQVTGIDISKRMLELAQQRVPKATFEVGDMTELQFEDDSLDGIVSTYAVFHIPRTKHLSLFQDFHRILKKGGALLFSIGSKEIDATDGVWEWEEFQSVPMFWSYHPPSKTVELLKSADFQIVFSRNVEQAGETHFWILARAK
ncbi:MAG: class I SAM-dependent methyltransferase [Candidatus Thorarchaeota archaeon]|jgi:ubiquinone/menaquinone biosynthesis C-methylase UbiE